MLHLIDIYVGADELEQNKYFNDRHNCYSQVFKSKNSEPALFRSTMPCDDGSNLADFAFSPEFATNPDSVMYDWRSIAPDLHEVREQAQLCTLLVHAVKD